MPWGWGRLPVTVSGCPWLTAGFSLGVDSTVRLTVGGLELTGPVLQGGSLPQGCVAACERPVSRSALWGLGVCGGSVGGALRSGVCGRYVAGARLGVARMTTAASSHTRPG
eukprot:CAMPEP_0175949444 /NCGR_PEP_ID=MMETSP0108-20121206/29035_1 /TAXON_ID=195067 ORGANISM="Goniomonas pacifica, Strain CCMP1869" /NCGR_SAMPLE_ID=MMETSP0108 /ASSEMBLY_ACC=CAM_ASM_000204 /LENGTH=110 /DNA_ID=CAMNT_0017275367 /DNA_START=630 /DNA_END=962 /DNA_ORIENTATION=+